MENNVNLSYQSSGKTGSLSLFWFIILILIVLPVLSYIYAYLIWYTPIIGLNIIIVIGFSYVIGLTISRIVIKLGKVRSSKFGIFLTTIATLSALYYAWAVWITLYFNVEDSYDFGRLTFSKSFASSKDVLRLITHPDEMLILLQEIYESGTWSISTRQNHEGTGPINGTFIILSWIIEAILIILYPFTKTLQSTRLPFSEEFDIWLPAQKSKKLIYIENVFEELKINQDQLETILHLQKNKSTSYSQLIIYGLPNSEKYLTILNFQSLRNGKSELTFKKLIPINQILINDDLYYKIKNQIDTL